MSELVRVTNNTKNIVGFGEDQSLNIDDNYLTREEYEKISKHPLFNKMVKKEQIEVLEKTATLEPKDLIDGTLEQIEKRLMGIKSVDLLEGALTLEKAGKNRDGALSLLEKRIAKVKEN